MQGLRKKILLNIFLTPYTILPFVSGLSLLILSEFLGSQAAFLGLISMLVGVGIALSQLIFNYESAAKQIIEELRTKDKKDQVLFLNDLDRKLTLDRDPRDQEALRNLRSIYDSFMEDVEASKITVTVTAEILAQIRELFDATVKHLVKQHEMWQTSKKVQGEIKAKILAQREKVIQNVIQCVESLEKFVGEIRAMDTNSDSAELETYQRNLNLQLETTKRTEKFFKELEADDTQRFAEYTKPT